MFRPFFASSFLILATLPARSAAGVDGLKLTMIKESPGRVILAGNGPAAGVTIDRSWNSGICRLRLTNRTGMATPVKEVVAFSIPHTLPPATRFYGEGFQMLSQTAGTLSSPVNLGAYTDASHYKMPQSADATVAYGVITLAPPTGDRILLGFGSCRRFVGRFEVRARSIEVILDTEGLELAPGESWDLEELVVETGGERPGQLRHLAARLCANHPPRIRANSKIPAGWCSWYCFGPAVTSKQVLDTLDVITARQPQLRYVQLDDGYQAAMGDWLETGKAFGGGARELLRKIRGRGFEPAIWVAPFIAERGSRLFREHPDWFMKGPDGQPLPSSRVTFGGWRHGPWFALDGTHPQARKHLESVFRTMRDEWGCTYFKLDANFWGAMHGGKLHDPKATRVEAYRLGMQAVLRGAGDSFILGCNHPLWPSLGLIDGSRSSGDISRTWQSFAETSRENLSRNWQNGRLWWNDPDCAVFTGRLSDEEFVFHATTLRATGGLVLSGDDLTKLGPDGFDRLRRLLPPSGFAAEFEDDSLTVGRARFPDHEEIYVFNRSGGSETRSIKLGRNAHVVDLRTGAELPIRNGMLTLEAIPPHSARILGVTLP